MPLKGGTQLAPTAPKQNNNSFIQALQQALLQQQMIMQKNAVDLAFKAGYGYSSGGGYGGGGGSAGPNPLDVKIAKEKQAMDLAGVKLDWQNQLAALALNEKQAKEGAAINQRQWIGDATARGARTAGGTKQGETDIATQLANALSGIGLQRKGLNEDVYFKMWQLNQQAAQLRDALAHPGGGGGGGGSGSYGGFGIPGSYSAPQGYHPTLMNPGGGLSAQAQHYLAGRAASDRYNQQQAASHVFQQYPSPLTGAGSGGGKTFR